MASQQNLSTTPAHTKNDGGSPHPGTPLTNEHYQFEWTTSECEATGNLVDELRITCDEYDAALSERFIYDTHLQDHSPRTRRTVHPAARTLRDQATTASATASCESLPLQSTSSAQSEQYDFFQRYENTWDTRSITDCESVEATILPELTRTDSGYESITEDTKMDSPARSPASTARLSQASTLASPSTQTSRATVNNSDWHTHLSARDSFELDRNGLRLCDGGRMSTSTTTSFEVLDVRLPQSAWIPHRDSLELYREGARQSTAVVCQRDSRFGKGLLKRGWLKVKAKFCGKCEQERIERRAMVNYL